MNAHRDLIKELEHRLAVEFGRYHAGTISEEELMYTARTMCNSVFEEVRCEYYCIRDTNTGRVTFTEPITFFSLGEGYDSEDFMRIADLKLGESVTLNQHPLHMIIRIK